MKRATISILSLVSFLTFAAPTYAVNFCPFRQFTKLCELDPNDNTHLVGNIFTLLLVAAVLLSVGFLILGGIRWIIAGGDKGKIDSARSTIIGAIVGLVISFMAFFVLSFINYLFGVESRDSTSGTVFEIPRLFDNANKAQTNPPPATP